MKATELMEELERLITDYGDGECNLPDPLENWWYPLDRIEYDYDERAFRFVSDR